jgi:hypothetical protein
MLSPCSRLPPVTSAIFHGLSPFELSDSHAFNRIRERLSFNSQTSCTIA